MYILHLYMHVFDCICTCCTCIPTSSWSAFVWAFRENAIILVASGNSSRFRKKKSRFVEFCSWPWPFTLIGTGCRTCWLPRNLFDKTLLHSQSSRSFSRYLKPNYAKLFEWGLSKDPLPVHRLLWFSQGNGLCPSKNKGCSTRKCAFSLGKNAFSPGKSAFSIFFMFFNITFMSYLFRW